MYRETKAGLATTGYVKCFFRARSAAWRQYSHCGIILFLQWLLTANADYKMGANVKYGPTCITASDAGKPNPMSIVRAGSNAGR